MRGAARAPLPKEANPMSDVTLRAQVLAEALCCLGGGAEAGRAMDRKLPGEKSRGTARLRQ